MNCGLNVCGAYKCCRWLKHVNATTFQLEEEAYSNISNTITFLLEFVAFKYLADIQGCQFQIHWKIFSAERKMPPLLISTFSSSEHLLAGDLLWTSYFLLLLKVRLKKKFSKWKKNSSSLVPRAILLRLIFRGGYLQLTDWCYPNHTKEKRVVPLCLMSIGN